MGFTGKIIKSYDPEYTVEFIYSSPNHDAFKGRAEVVRKQPKLAITYDNTTLERLKEMDITKLELEITNLVLNDLLAGRDKKSFRRGF